LAPSDAGIASHDSSADHVRNERHGRSIDDPVLSNLHLANAETAEVGG
jgi:hypothetical protein